MQMFSASAQSISISVTATASTSVNLPGIGTSVRLVNEGPNRCYVSIGSGSQTATVPDGTAVATATPVLAGADVILGVQNPPSPASGNPTPLQISAVCRTGETATLIVQCGEGY